MRFDGLPRVRFRSELNQCCPVPNGPLPSLGVEGLALGFIACCSLKNHYWLWPKKILSTRIKIDRKKKDQKNIMKENI